MLDGLGGGEDDGRWEPVHRDVRLATLDLVFSAYEV